MSALRGLRPPGVSYKNRHFEPYPFFVREARGAKPIDLDGKAFTEYCTHSSSDMGLVHTKVPTQFQVL